MLLEDLLEATKVSTQSFAVGSSLFNSNAMDSVSWAATVYVQSKQLRKHKPSFAASGKKNFTANSGNQIRNLLAGLRLARVCSQHNMTAKV
ncbi:MAG: hypothetical protein AAF423_03145 [Pseudomonadota bacterium]